MKGALNRRLRLSLSEDGIVTCVVILISYCSKCGFPHLIGRAVLFRFQLTRTVVLGIHIIEQSGIFFSFYSKTEYTLGVDN